MQPDLNCRSVIRLTASRKSSRGLLLAGVSAASLLLASHGAGAAPLNSGPVPAPTTGSQPPGG